MPESPNHRTKVAIWSFIAIAVVLDLIGISSWQASEEQEKSGELLAGLGEAVLAVFSFGGGFVSALIAVLVALFGARRLLAAALAALALTVAVPLATVPDVFGGGSSTPDAPEVSGWKPLGPSGATIEMVVTDYRRPNVVYSSISGEEAVRSRDGGKTWHRTGAELAVLAVDPAQPQTLYAGATGYPQDKVLKSIDGGESWAPANNGLRGAGAESILSPGVTAIAIDPKTPQTLYAATSGAGVFRSTNGGGSWSRLSRVSKDKDRFVAALAVDPRRPSTLYAGMSEDFEFEGAGLFRSTNGGRSWRRTALEDSVASIAIDPRNPRIIYATSGITSYKSTDSGIRWSELTFPVDVTTHSFAIDRSRPETVYVAASVLISDESLIFKSTNGGESWAIVARTTETVDDLSAFFGNANLAVDPTGRRVYVGTPGVGILVCETCWTVESPRRATQRT